MKVEGIVTKLDLQDLPETHKIKSFTLEVKGYVDKDSAALFFAHIRDSAILRQLEVEVFSSEGEIHFGPKVTIRFGEANR